MCCITSCWLTMSALSWLNMTFNRCERATRLLSGWIYISFECELKILHARRSLLMFCSNRHRFAHLIPHSSCVFLGANEYAIEFSTCGFHLTFTTVSDSSNRINLQVSLQCKMLIFQPNDMETALCLCCVQTRCHSFNHDANHSTRSSNQMHYNNNVIFNW